MSPIWGVFSIQVEYGCHFKVLGIMDGSHILDDSQGREIRNLVLRLASQAQTPWMSPQTNTYDMCKVSFTSNWDIVAMTSLVVN